MKEKRTTADQAGTMRDDAYLRQCLKAPATTLIRADDHTEVKRVLSVDGTSIGGTYIDVSCVKDVVVLVEHPGDAQCHLDGCSSRCRNCGVLIRYVANGVKKSKIVDTVHQNLKPELVPELVTSLKWEIEHGTTTVISPDDMARTLIEAQPAA